MRIIELLLLGIGLAMDSFAVSICKGMAVRKLSIKQCLICGIWFAVFHFVMPLIGYLVGSGFETFIHSYAPWIAFGLLAYIGISMIREALEDEEEENNADFSFRNMLMLAIATSIDALAVGVTFVAVPVRILNGSSLINTLIACVIISIIIFSISFSGVIIGNQFGKRYKSGSEVLGGTILIFIGINTLIDSISSASDNSTIYGLLIPLIGTIIGSGYVYVNKSRLSSKLRIILAGGSIGIMMSITIWGLIEPSFHFHIQSQQQKPLLIFLCFLLGTLIQYGIDHLVPHTHAFSNLTEGMKSDMDHSFRVMMAEVIHHIPEGFALGAVYAGYYLESDWISSYAAIILAIGFAIQNFPEALFVAMPIRERGEQIGKAFMMGCISGISIPIVGAITIALSMIVPQFLPYILALAGGSMIFNTVEEIPTMSVDEDNDKATISFIIGFSLIMLMFFIK